MVRVINGSLLNNYQEGMVEKLKGNDFVFDCVNRLYHKYYKITLNLKKMKLVMDDIQNKKAT